MFKKFIYCCISLFIFSSQSVYSQQTSLIAQLNAEKKALMDKVKKGTLQIFNQQADPFIGPISATGGSGTGFIVNIEDGYATVFTNRHVTDLIFISKGEEEEEEGAVSLSSNFLFRQISVGKKFGQHSIVKKAKADLVFVSPVYDFAILKFKLSDLGPEAENYFKPLDIVETHEELNKILQQGSLVLAYGYPQGTTEVATEGTISATGQKLQGTNSAILHNAPINSGNSGGPLIDMESGRVVGINTWKFHNSDNMGFAQQISSIWHEYQRFLKNNQYGSRKLPYSNIEPIRISQLENLGVYQGIKSLVPDLSENVDELLLVGFTQENSPLYSGDIIIRIEGEFISGSIEQFKKIYNFSRKKNMKIDVYRSGSIISLEVPIFKKVTQTELFINYAAFSGVVVRDLTAIEKDLLGLDHGVVIGGTYEDIKSQTAPGLLGSILTEVQGPLGFYSIKNLENFVEYLMDTPVGNTLTYRAFLPASPAIFDSELDFPVRNIIRPSRVIFLPYSGVVTSHEIPLDEYRKNYDFTGVDLPRSNLGAVVQSICEQALYANEEPEEGEFINQLVKNDTNN